MRKVYAVFSLLLTLSSAASAHTALTVSNPADGEVLEGFPENLELQFSEPVRLVRAELFAVSADTERKIDLDFEPSAFNGKEQLVPLPMNLGPGEYRVTWSVLGADGHPVSGQFTFSTGVEQGHDHSTVHGSHQSQSHSDEAHDSVSHNHN